MYRNTNTPATTENKLALEVRVRRHMRRNLRGEPEKWKYPMAYLRGRTSYRKTYLQLPEKVTEGHYLIFVNY